MRWTLLRVSQADRPSLIVTHVLAQAMYLCRVAPMPSSIAAQLNTLVFRRFVFNGAVNIPSFEVMGNPLAYGGLMKRPLGLVEDMATANLAMAAVHHHSGRTAAHDQWMWFFAAEELSRLCGAAQSVVNGFPYSDNMVKLTGNPCGLESGCVGIGATVVS